MCNFCKDCKERHTACHDTCDVYTKWLKEYRERERQEKVKRKEYRDLFYERSKGC